MSSVLVRFDPSNKQQDFQFMAKAKDTGEFVIGYVYVDKPWFSNPSMWSYFILSNKYSNTGLCGGKEDIGMEKIAVCPSSIIVYNQTA